MAFIGSWSSPGLRPAAGPRFLKSAWTRLRDYLSLNDCQRRIRCQEAYLAQSASLEDLERRMRELDSEERRPRFIGYF
jgi:hypothetical protein